MIITSSFLGYNRFNIILREKDKAMEKLSSGFRINSAGDDAAGLAISEKMRAQINGQRMASRNVQDGISLIQSAEGAMNEDHALLQRIRELTVQAANDVNTAHERDAIAQEVSSLIEETDRILAQTEFNTQKLFLGLDADPITLQTGANSGQSFQLFIKKSVLPSYGYFVWEAGSLIIGAPGDDKFVDLSTNANANQFLTVLDKAIADLSSERSNLGAAQNCLEHTKANLNTSEENLSAAESQIRDADIAFEMANYLKQQILMQSSMAIQAQANQVPREILRLLQ